MFTLIGFNQAVSEAAALVNIAGAKDQHVKVVDDVIYVPEKFTKILWTAALIYDGTRAYLLSPSLRKMGVYFISPSCNLQTAEEYRYASRMAAYCGDCPLSLITGEGLEAFAKTNTDTTYLESIAVCLGDALVAPVKGEIWTVRATVSSLTTVASQWVNEEIVFDETLPVGRYQVVGAQCYSAPGTLFRLVPIGGMNRPGGICVGMRSQWAPIWQRRGNMGVWCEFHSTTPPSLDMLGFYEGASEVSLYLDLIKVA